MDDARREAVSRCSCEGLVGLPFKTRSLTGAAKVRADLCAIVDLKDLVPTGRGYHCLEGELTERSAQNERI
jgi:hypothetical protein